MKLGLGNILAGSLLHLAIIAVLYGTKDVFDTRTYNAWIGSSDVHEDLGFRERVGRHSTQSTTTTEVAVLREEHGSLYR